MKFNEKLHDRRHDSIVCLHFVVAVAVLLLLYEYEFVSRTFSQLIELSSWMAKAAKEADRLTMCNQMLSSHRRRRRRLVLCFACIDRLAGRLNLGLGLAQADLCAARFGCKNTPLHLWHYCCNVADGVWHTHHTHTNDSLAATRVKVKSRSVKAIKLSSTLH